MTNTPRHNGPYDDTKITATPADRLSTGDADVPPPKSPTRLKRVFNAAAGITAGAVLTYGIRGAAVAAGTWVSAPAVVTLAASYLAVGLSAGIINQIRRQHRAWKTGTKAAKFWDKDNRKVMLKGTAFGVLGGVAMLGLEHWLSGLGNTAAVTPAAPTPVATTAPPVHSVAPPAPPADLHVVTTPAQPVTPPPAPAVPAAPPPAAPVVAHPVAPAPSPAAPTPVAPAVVTPTCHTPMAEIRDIVAHHHVTPDVKGALHRAMSHNAHVMEQGRKDLAYYLFNGLHGMPKNQGLALQAFCDAAHHGNVQAQVDQLYIKYYGLAGTHADPQAALEGMKHIHNNARAEWFVKQWSKVAGHAAHHAKAAVSAVKAAVVPAA